MSRLFQEYDSGSAALAASNAPEMMPKELLPEDFVKGTPGELNKEREGFFYGREQEMERKQNSVDGSPLEALESGKLPLSTPISMSEHMNGNSSGNSNGNSHGGSSSGIDPNLLDNNLFMDTFGLSPSNEELSGTEAYSQPSFNSLLDDYVSTEMLLNSNNNQEPMPDVINNPLSEMTDSRNSISHSVDFWNLPNNPNSRRRTTGFTGIDSGLSDVLNGYSLDLRGDSFSGSHGHGGSGPTSGSQRHGIKKQPQRSSMSVLDGSINTDLFNKIYENGVSSSNLKLVSPFENKNTMNGNDNDNSNDNDNDINNTNNNTNKNNNTNTNTNTTSNNNNNNTNNTNTIDTSHDGLADVDHGLHSLPDLEPMISPKSPKTVIGTGTGNGAIGINGGSTTTLQRPTTGNQNFINPSMVLSDNASASAKVATAGGGSNDATYDLSLDPQEIMRESPGQGEISVTSPLVLPQGLSSPSPKGQDITSTAMGQQDPLSLNVSQQSQSQRQLHHYSQQVPAPTTAKRRMSTANIMTIRNGNGSINVQNHPSVASRNNNRSITPMNISDEDSKPFKCKECSKAFRRSEHLKRHIRSVHSSERPFACMFCEKKFSRSDNLSQHLKTHKKHGDF